MSVAVIGLGSTLEYENPGATWNLVGGIKTLTPFSKSVDIIDVSDHDSTVAKEKIASLLADNGQVTFGGNYDPGDVDHLYLEDNPGLTVSFRITGTDTGATVWSFSAIVQAVSTDMPYDGVYSFSITLEITGAITRV